VAVELVVALEEGADGVVLGPATLACDPAVEPVERRIDAGAPWRLERVVPAVAGGVTSDTG